MTELASLKSIIKRRRDVRAEFSGTPPTPSELSELLDAAHCAPSVGNSQPWDFIVINDPATLQSFARHVDECRTDYAESLDSDRRATFEPIKIEGIRESGMGIVVTYDPTRSGPNVLGRRTVDDAGIFSTVCAIQNLWLTATALNLGVGWVSFYREPYLKELLSIPEHIRVVAWLCVGRVTHLHEIPDLIRAEWNRRLPLDDLVHQDRW